MSVFIAVENYYGDTLLTPGKVYMIVETTSGKTVTVAYGVPYLQHIKGNNNEHTHRVYSEASNYYGFFNEASGKYLDHNAYAEIRASAETMLDWEYFTSVDIAEDVRRLQRGVDGSTLWQLVKVSK
ncbi:hypothetical protein V8C40DRAFT_279174 [Trichoderma camerunense]